MRGAVARNHTPSRCSLWAALALLAALLVPRVSSAQISGRVVGADGRQPVPQALVELLSASGVEERAYSDAEGRFALRNGNSRDRLVLLVRRIGFAPARIDSVLPGREYSVAMREHPVPLPEMYVASCPAPDDPESRRIWEEARSRYVLVPDTVAVWVAHGSISFGSAGAAAVGYLPLSQWTTRGQGQGVTSSGFRRNVLTVGYAYRRPPGRYHGAEFGRWQYPRLDGGAAEHFADSLFGALHTFQVPHRVGDLVDIGFCPRSAGRPDIEGVITIMPGHGLVAAGWRFVMPPGEEEAGGQVVFLPASDSAPGFLLPSYGVYWRRPRGSPQYLQWIHQYDRFGVNWRFARER